MDAPAPPRRPATPWIALGILAATAAVAIGIGLRARRGPAPDADSAKTPERAAPETANPLGASPREKTSAPTPRGETPSADLAPLGGADVAAAKAAAVRWRLAARTDDAVFRALVAALLDPATPALLRERIATVLGTIDDPRTDPALLAALERHGDSPALVAAIALALGAQRTPPDDDEVFDLGERPHGVTTAGGLGITLRRRIEDASTRAVIVGLLASASKEVRYAAARALAESVAEEDVRTATRARLGSETEDAVVARLAEPLAAWARTAEPSAERDAVFALALDLAFREGFDEARLRMEKDLATSEMGDAALARLATGFEPSRPPEVRRFVLTVLPAAAARGSDAAREAAARLLEDAIARDPADDIRDLAARGFESLPAGERSLAVLRRAAAEDRAWRVRYAAVSALGRHANRSAVEASLVAATKDPEPRVAAEAKRILGR